MPKGLQHCNSGNAVEISTDSAVFAWIRPVLAGLRHSNLSRPATSVPMPATPDDLFAYLDRLNIPHATVTHPPLFTVADSQSLRGTIPGGHTKNLFLKDKADVLFLVVADEDAAIDMKSLHHRLGSKRLSFGSAALLTEVLGIPPGSVTPFAAINDAVGRVTVILDQAMMAHETLNFHPLTNTMTTSIARDDLPRFLCATGHPPRILAVSATPAGAVTAD